MDFLKDNLPLIIFALSIIGMIIKQKIDDAKIKMKIEEMEADLQKMQTEIEKDKAAQNKMFSILAEIRADFKWIKDTLKRHENELR